MRVLLGFGLGQNLKLILKIDDSFLVLLAEHVGGFLRFHVDIFEQFPQFGQLGVAFLVHFQLTRRNIHVLGSETQAAKI